MAQPEIRACELDADEFIADQAKEISGAVGHGTAINALSGGVDSSVVTLLGHRALGDRLKTYFVQNGLMRQGEPERVAALFADLGVKVELVDAQDEFFSALAGVTDPEQKREAITQTFYKDVFGRLVRQSGAKHLLQGTILTDIDETVAAFVICCARWCAASRSRCSAEMRRRATSCSARPAAARPGTVAIGGSSRYTIDSRGRATIREAEQDTRPEACIVPQWANHVRYLPPPGRFFLAMS